MAIATTIEEKGFALLSALPKPVRGAAISTINNYRREQMNMLESPLSMIFYVTNYCNAKCNHCFYWQELNTKKEELGLEDMKNIAKTLKLPLRTLMLTGGEPYLRKDLAEIIVAFYRINRTRRITTPSNGTYTDRVLETTKRILQECPDLQFHVQVSLDGPEEMHDTFRHLPGCYRKASETINQLLALRETTKQLDISIMTTICTANSLLLPEFVKEIRKKFPKAMHKFNILRGAHLGTYRVPKEVSSHLDGEIGKANAVSTKELQKIFDEVITPNISKHQDRTWQNFQRLKWQYSVDLLETQKRVVKCTAGKTFAVVYPNGNVAICEATKPFANLHDYEMNFEKLWKSQAAEDMRKKLTVCDCIHPCNLLDSMSYDTKTLIKLSELD